MAKNKKKRTALAKANKKDRTKRKKGKKWLELPSGFSEFKEKAGKSFHLNFLPYIVETNNHPDKDRIPEDIWWKYPYKVHRQVGPSKQDVICPTTVGKPCPMCEERFAIYDDPDGDDDVARQLKPSSRSLFIVQPTKGDNKEIMIWDISDFCFMQVLDEELDDGEEEWGNFPALEDGYTLKIRFKEETIGSTSFPKTSRIDFHERKDLDDSILEEVPCLDNMIQIPTYEQVRAIFYGEDIPDEEEDNEEQEEEEEKPKPKKSTKKKKEPEPEPEEEEEEEEEQEEPPKKKKPKKEKPKKKAENKCPHGHKFGEEFGDHDECEEEECDKYDECFDAYNELDED